MECFLYSFEGISELSLIISINCNKCWCTASFKTGSYEFESKDEDLHYERIIGSMNQYILKMIAMMVVQPNDILKKHVTDITKFLKLMTTIPFTNFAYLLKYNFYEKLYEGVKMWMIIIKNLLSYDETEVEKLVKTVSRYITLTHLFLREHMQEPEGITFSPLCKI